MFRPKRTTTTLKIVEALKVADDFLTIADLVRITGEGGNRVWAATSHLRGCKVLDCVIQDGTSYWYYAGEICDTRIRVIKEIVEGIHKKPGRRLRERSKRGTIE